MSMRCDESLVSRFQQMLKRRGIEGQLRGGATGSACGVSPKTITVLFDSSDSGHFARPLPFGSPFVMKLTQ